MGRIIACLFLLTVAGCSEYGFHSPQDQPGWSSDGNATPGDDDDDDDGDLDDPDDPDWPSLDRDPDWPGLEVPPGELHMTGGGGIPHVGGIASHGFTIHCDDGKDNHHLQINWASGSFHLEEVDWVQCWDDPGISGGQPDPGFDTLEMAGWGRLDGIADTAIYLVFTDDGEPGTTDTAEVLLDDGWQPVWLAGVLEDGNHQAH